MPLKIPGGTVSYPFQILSENIKMNIPTYGYEIKCIFNYKCLKQHK